MNEQALKYKLKKASKALDITFNEAWHTLVLERFLVRVSSSKHRDKFVFKEGLLLARFVDLGRETRDLDFLLQKTQAEKRNIELLIKETASIDIDDGFQFDFQSINDLNHAHMKYPGFEVALLSRFGKLRQKVSVDIGVGDVVDPIPSSTTLTRVSSKGLYEDSLSLLTYSPESIFAEKLETAASRGEANSRMKDYHDMVALILNPGVLEPKKTAEAIRKTFYHRKTSLDLIPLSFSEKQLQQLERYWAAHRRKLSRSSAEKVPKVLADAISMIRSYLAKLELS